MKNLGKFAGMLMMGLFLVSTWFLIIPGATLGQEVIQLKAAALHPAAHRLTKDAYELWGNEISKRTHGKVKITWFPGGTLAKTDQLYEAMVGGLADISVIAAYVYPHIFPIDNILSLPFIVDSPVHAADVGWEMYQTIPEFKKELSKFKVLGFFSTDVSNLALAKPPLIKSLEDLKGRQIIVGSPAGVDILRLLGGVAQFQKTEDMYLSLQRKMADGVLFPNAPLRSFKLVELTRYYTIMNVAVGPFIVGMRQETWQKLPPDVQKAFEETGPSFSRLCAHTLNNEGLWVLEELKKRGDEFYYLPQQQRVQWREATKPFYAKWAKTLDDKGLKGQAIIDKVLTISDKAREHPSGVDDWWKQGRMGKK
jgi:TRAP-type transport system periplasmic protein